MISPTRVAIAAFAAAFVMTSGSAARAVLLSPATAPPTSSPDLSGQQAPSEAVRNPSYLSEPIATPTPDPLDQPPPGITPVKATLADVLQNFRKSIGKPVMRVATMRESDTVTAWGETGTYSEVVSGDDYVDTMHVGPTSTAEGQYKGQRWTRNENGFTRLISGVHQETNVSMQAIQRSIVGRSTENVRLLGERAGPPAAYVVEVDPPAGRHEWLFFDAATGRLIREEAVHVSRRVVWTFDDFRTTNGIVQAWHQHYSDGYAKNEMDWRTASLQYDVPVLSTELEAPKSRAVVAFPPDVQSVRLPARIDDGTVIVRVVINGRGLDFALDSGSDSIVIDRDVARQLGLQTFGESTQTVAGTFEQATAIVPTMKIGDLTMTDVVVDALPFNVDLSRHTKVVGLLGYDFLAGIVAKVDYMAGTVDAYDPATFTLPPGELFSLGLALDDAVPMVSARIGDSVGDHFMVDTGSDFVVVFSAFAKAHADDVSDSDDSRTGEYFFPVIQASGVGGGLSLVPTQVKAFHFAGVGFQHFLVFKVLNAPSFEGEDSDGLIGYEFLQYFDVYFDYQDSILLLQPNRLLHEQSTKPSN